MNSTPEFQATTGARPRNLLVFSDDWGRHPSSCQHLVSRLLDRYQVLWVNTIGMRPPRLNKETFRRGMEKLRHWRKRNNDQTVELPTSLRVINPKMWPWISSKLDRKLNRRLLGKQVASAMARSEGEWIGISTLPLVADFMDDLPVKHWVYYCVDDFTVWPGLDHRPLAEMELKLVQKASTRVAASQSLRNRLRSMDVDQASLLTHGVDLEHWNSSSESIVQLDDLATPLVVFWGLIDQRMDLSFVKSLSDGLNGGTILLIGPTDNPPAELFELPHVRHLAPMSLTELASVGQRADVLVMPYIDADVTRAMQPLKFLEYLATGKPVVSRKLPATEPWADAADLVENEAAFASAVITSLERGVTPEQQTARTRLEQESWGEKAKEFERLLLEENEC